jgi:hypothetical protein
MIGRHRICEAKALKKTSRPRTQILPRYKNHYNKRYCHSITGKFFAARAPPNLWTWLIEPGAKPDCRSTQKEKAERMLSMVSHALFRREDSNSMRTLF